MRTLLLASLAIVAAGCGTIAEKPLTVASGPAETTKLVEAVEATKPTETVTTTDAAKPAETVTTTDAAKPTDADAGVFTLKPAPKSFLALSSSGTGVRGYVSSRNKNGTGAFSARGMAPIRFKINKPTEKGKPTTMSIDWNRNNDFTDDDSMELPKGNKVVTATIMLDKRMLNIAITGRTSRGNTYLMLRQADWLEGMLELDGKLRRAALVDLSFNGIDTKSGDLLMIDVNGDGKLSSRGGSFEGQAPVADTIMLQNGIFDFSYDAATSKATLTRSTNVGTLVVAHPKWDKTSIVGMVRGPTGYQRFSSDGDTITLPSGAYSNIYLTVNAESGKDKYSMRVRTSKLTITKGESSTVSIEPPTGVQPKLKITGNKLKIREEMVFAKAPVGIQKNYSITANSKRIPAPKFEVYNGADKVAQGVMKYGWGGLCEYSCSIPKDKVATGEKLTVKMTWDTKMFGVLKGEKTIEWSDEAPKPKTPVKKK